MTANPHQIINDSLSSDDENSPIFIQKNSKLNGNSSPVRANENSLISSFVDSQDDEDSDGKDRYV